MKLINYQSRQMFKVFFATLALMGILSFSTYAGFKELAASEKIEEPRAGYLKIMNDRDGHTYLFTMRPGQKMMFRKFDPQHKLIATKELAFTDKDIMKADALELYLIEDKIVFFLSDMDGRIPVLYRVLIDKQALSVLKEEKVAEMPKVKIKVFFGGPPKDFDLSLPYFEITKDDDSDNYAVCAFNTRAEQPEEAIEISHYNSKHELISKGYCNVTGQPDVRIRNISLTVEQDKKVTVLAIADRNLAFWGSRAAGQAAFEFKKLDFEGMAGQTDALLRFNPATGTYIIVSVKKTLRGGDIKYLSYVSRFNPSTGSLVTEPANLAKIDGIARTQYRKKERFDGWPQDLFIHEDGSYTIVYEEAEMKEYNYNTFADARSVGRMRTAYKFFLKDIGITTYDQNGAERQAYYVPKSHQIDQLIAPFRYKRKRNAVVHLSTGFQYKQFYYFQSPKNRYVLFNDYEDNQEKIESHSGIKTVLALNESVAYAFDLNQQAAILKRQELWPYQDKKKNGWLALFAASDYNPETNTLTTLKLDYRDKEMQLVWLQPE